ncbi:MAG: DUF2062 domain-containing protein [Desulfuromonadaceae bacterium]|nr:DUF2062 domain-containing protein [Desulfuromonadaceae bacterium]
MCITTGFNAPAAQRLKGVVGRMFFPVLKRFQNVLTCGLTAQKSAQLLCVGFAFGVMPLVWGTSLICIVVAHILKLNHVALQSINYLLYPLQLVLLLPFFMLGARLFPWGPPLPPHLFAAVLRNPGTSWYLLCWITLKSLAAWLVTVVPVAVLAYGLLMALAFMKNAHTPRV